jgi:hypothetical protein
LDYKHSYFSKAIQVVFVRFAKVEAGALYFLCVAINWKVLRKVTYLGAYVSAPLVLMEKTYLECRLEWFFISSACIMFPDVKM